MARSLGLFLVIWFLVGCVTNKRAGRIEPFPDVYAALPAEVDRQEEEKRIEPKITVSARDQQLRDFIRMVVDQSGISVITEEGLDTRPVTVEAQGVPVSELMSSVARRVGAELTFLGQSYYLGQLRPEDRGLLVRRVARLSSEEAQQMAGVFLSEYGRVSVHGGGLLIVADRVAVLHRIAETLDKVENTPYDCWVLQLYLADVAESDLRETGIDFDQMARLSFSAMATKPGAVVKAGAAELALGAVLRLDRERDSTSILARPLLLVADGVPTTWHSGQRVPVPRRTVSDNGTVTTSGFDYIDTGFLLDGQVRLLGPGSALLSLTLESSQILSFVEEAPLVSTDRIKTTVTLNDRGVYLLGSLRSSSEKRTGSGPGFVTSRRDQLQAREILVFARVYRTFGAALEAPPVNKIILDAKTP